MKKILCVASAGGHWVQLLRLRPAFEEHNIIYISTEKSLRETVKGSRFYCVPDANRNNVFSLVLLFFSMVFIIFATRPQVIVSTGAAPGFFAFLFGKLFRSKNIWIDSIANIDKMSLTGLLSKHLSNLWLTQWDHLAGKDGPFYKGKVI